MLDSHVDRHLRSGTASDSSSTRRRASPRSLPTKFADRFSSSRRYAGPTTAFAHRRRWWTAVVVAGCLVAPLTAGDWPQILGPDRNGHADNETLAGNWNDKPPARRWQHRVGSGYAGPAVVGDRVLVFHRRDDQEVLDCLSVDDGKLQWSAAWPASYRGGIDPDDGPRCVPLVDADQVFVLGAGGDLHCADLATGHKLWSRELARELRAQDGYFGVGSSPIMARGTLLVNVGGRDGAGIVALDPTNGRTQWEALDDQASYSAPTLWRHDEREDVIFVTRLHVFGIDPKNGRELFRAPFGKRGPTVNAATPLVQGPDQLFLTASYGIGAKLLAISDGAVRTLWQGDDVLSSQYPTPIWEGNFLFGIHGREDGPPAALRCVEADSGKVRWEQTRMGMAHLILADDKLLALRVEGELLLLEPNSSEYRELGRLRLSRTTTRALPALAKGRLYVRDVAGDLACWQLP